MTFYPETPSTNGTTSITSRDFTANWKTQQYTLNPLGADRKDVDFYEVQYGTRSSPNSGSYRTERTTKSARSRRFTVSNRGGVYYWRVRGYSAKQAGLGLGWSNWSPSVRVNLPSGVPSTPSSSIGGVSSEAVYFTWGAPSGNGESISGYQVQRASNASSFSSRVGTVTTSSSARGYRFGGLNRATTYYFRVRARTEGGYGSWSKVRSATTKPTVPSTPRSFFVNPRSNGAVVGIGWVAPSDNGGRSVSRYEIIRWSSRGSVLQRYSYSGSTTHTEISGLTPGATYLWSMRAINSVGKGGLTTRLRRKMNRPPEAPTLSSVEVIDGDTARITFWRSGASDGGTPITGYNIIRATNSSFSQGVVYKKVASTGAHTINGLKVGTRYYWYVRAVNAVTDYIGNSGGDRSATKSAIQDDLLGAPAFTSLVAQSTGRAITLEWIQPVLNGRSAPNSYTIYRYDATGKTLQKTYTSSLWSITIGSLVAGRAYQWAIAATNDMGRGAVSAKVRRVQPSPSVKAGDYFDGSTPSDTDVTYSWAGTAHGSHSIAQEYSPLGWTLFNVAAASSGGAGVVTYNTDNPRFRKGAAFATFWSPAAEGAGFLLGLAAVAQVPEEGDMVGSMYVYPSRDQAMRAVIIFYDGSMTPLDTATGPLINVSAEEYVRLSVLGYSPSGTAFARIFVQDAAGTLESGEVANWSRWEAGDTIYADGAMITVGSVLYPYFDGETTDTRQYTYEWLGEKDKSESRRLSTNWREASEDPLLDPDCPPFPTPPRPPAIDTSCAQTVNRWRRYWVDIPASIVPQFGSMLPRFGLRTTTQAVNQVRIRVYANPDNLPVDQLGDDDPVSTQVVSYVPADTWMIMDAMMGETFAEVGRRSAVPADHLVYGEDGTPPTWPELMCGQGYAVALDVPAILPVGSVSLTIRMARRYR